MKNIFADIDGTFVLEPTWKIVMRRYGVEQADTLALQKYISGLCTHDELLISTIETLQKVGATKSEIYSALQQLEQVPGLQTLLTKINGNGIAVISGGMYDCLHIHGIAKAFQEHHITRFQYGEQERITGYTLFNGGAQGKLQTFEEVRIRRELSYNECAYFGDAGNDLLVAERVVKNGGVFVLVEATHFGIQHSTEKDSRRLREIATVRVTNLEDAIPYVQ